MAKVVKFKSAVFAQFIVKMKSVVKGRLENIK